MEGLVTSPISISDDESVNAPPVEGLVQPADPDGNSESVNAPPEEGLASSPDGQDQFAALELDTAAGLVSNVETNMVVVRLPRGQDVVLTRPVIIALAENGVEIPVLGLVAIESDPEPSSPPPLSPCPALLEAAEVIPPLPAHVFTPDLTADSLSGEGTQDAGATEAAVDTATERDTVADGGAPNPHSSAPPGSPSVPISPAPSGTPVRDEAPGRDERKTEETDPETPPPLLPPVIQDTHADAPLEAVIFNSPRRRRRPRIVSKRRRPADIVAKAIRRREIRRDASNYYQVCKFKRRTRVAQYLQRCQERETEQNEQEVRHLRAALSAAMAERRALRERHEELLRQEGRVEERIVEAWKRLQAAEEARAKAAAGCAKYTAGWHKELERVFKSL